MSTHFKINDHIINLKESTITNPDGSKEPIKNNQLSLIELLMSSYPDFVTASEIKVGVWGHPHISNESVTQLVKQTRALLQDNNKSTIINLKGKGYTLSNFSECLSETSLTAMPSQHKEKDKLSSTSKLGRYDNIYLYASICFWTLVWGTFIYTEKREVYLKDVLDLEKIDFATSNTTDTGVVMSDGTIECHLNPISMEAICETKN